MKNRKTLFPAILLAALSLLLILSLPLLMDSVTGRSLSQPAALAAQASDPPAQQAPGTFSLTTDAPREGVVIVAPNYVLSMTDLSDRLSVHYNLSGGDSVDINAQARELLSRLTGLDLFETAAGKSKWVPSIMAFPFPGGLRFEVYFAEPAIEARVMDPEGGLSTNYQLFLFAGEDAGQPLVVDGFHAFTGPIGESNTRAASLAQSGASDMAVVREMAFLRGGEKLRALVDTAAARHRELAAQVFEGLNLNGQTFSITNYRTVGLTHNKPSNNSAAYTVVELYLELEDSRGQPYTAIIQVNPDLSTNLVSLLNVSEAARDRGF